MVHERRFCSSCGQPVDKVVRFCGNCGAPQGPTTTTAATPAAAFTPPPANYQPPPAYSPPPPAYTPPANTYNQAPSGQSGSGYPPQPGITHENLIGIVPGLSRKKNFVSSESFNLMVTSQRLIFAMMTNELVRQEAKEESQGKGFFGGIASAATVGYNFWRRYLEMSPEATLHESPDNFDLHLNQIRKVKFEGGRVLFKKGIISVGLNINRDDDEPAKLEIETMGAKYKFEVANHFASDARDVLRNAGLIK